MSSGGGTGTQSPGKCSGSGNPWCSVVSEAAIYYCPTCLTLSEPGTDYCLNCGAPAPEDGWPPVRTNRYPWLGQVVDGRYDFVQYIGFGSTGDVYRARMRSTGRSFAAKVIDRDRLPRRIDFEELSNRLRREVLVLGAVRSPYVVSVIDFIRMRDGDLVVIIMDLAQGTTLERMIYEQHRIPVFRALEIAEQLLEAISDVHERGVVHRDLKPENLVVRSQRSGRPFIQLLDFGIAKVDDDATMTHGFVGTPLFSSPEQIRNAELVDERSDLYAIGCIVFNMLTGQPPFFAERGSEVMRMHLTQPPPALSLRTGSRDLDEALSAFMVRALAKDPDDRFQTAMEMLAAPVFDLGRSFGLVPAAAVSSDTGDHRTVPPEEPAIRAVPDRTDARGHTAPTGRPASSSPSRAGVTSVVQASTGDYAATLSRSGALIAWSLPAATRLARTEVEPPGDEQAFVVVIDAGKTLALIDGDGTLHRTDAVTLERRESIALGGDEIRWAGRGLNQSSLLLLRKSAVELVRGEDGRRQTVELERGVSGPTVACRTTWGHVLYVPETATEIHVRETSDGISVRETPLVVRLQQDARLMDAAPGGRLLVAHSGRFMAVDGDGSGVEILTRSSTRTWLKARWMGQDGFVALTDAGELTHVRGGDTPVLIGRSVQTFDVSEDRTQVLVVEGPDKVRTWSLPGVPSAQVLSPVAGTAGDSPSGASAPKVGAVEDGPATEEERSWVWDMDPHGPALVCATDRALTRLDGDGMRVLGKLGGVPASLVVSNDGNCCAWVMEEGGGVTVLRFGGPQSEFAGLVPGRITQLALYDAGQAVIAADEIGTITALRLPRSAGSKPDRLWQRSLGQRISALRASALASTVIAGLGDGAIQLIDIHTGAIRSTIQPSGGPVQDAGFSFDGHMFVVLRGGESLEIHDCHAGRLAYRTQAGGGSARRVALLPDGTLLYGLMENGRLEVRRADSGAPVVGADLSTLKQG